MVSYLYSFNTQGGINENCKYPTTALIHNNIESGHPWWTTPLMVRGLDKRFNFRLDIGINNLNHMDEFVPVTKHMKSRESKIEIHSKEKSK